MIGQHQGHAGRNDARHQNWRYGAPLAVHGTDRECGRINRLPRQRGQTLAEMALAWLLRDKRVTSVIVGASSAAQIEDNLRALENASFSDDELARIDALSRE